LIVAEILVAFVSKFFRDIPVDKLVPGRLLHVNVAGCSGAATAKGSESARWPAPARWASSFRPAPS